VPGVASSGAFTCMPSESTSPSVSYLSPIWACMHRHIAPHNRVTHGSYVHPTHPMDALTSPSGASLRARCVRCLLSE